MDKVVARGHFGNHQARSKRSCKPPKRRVGHPGHRRQQNPVSDLDIANFQRIEEQ